MKGQRNVDFEHFVRHGKARRPIAGSVLLFSIIAFLVIGFIRAYFTEIDEVTRGQGKVVPSRSLQVIQSLEGGVVTEIRARRGDYVSEGDILLVLSGGTLEGEYEESLQRFRALQVRMHRLEAEINDEDLAFNDELLLNAPSVVASETRLYYGRRIELNSELQVLERQGFQRQQERAELEAALSTARSGVVLADRERAIIQPLAERGIEPETSLLQVQRTLNDLRGDVARQESAIQRVIASIDEIEDRKTAARNAYQADALAELSDATSQAAELEKVLPGRADQVARTNIRSPVEGIVNQVHISTVGGVAASGEPLIEVVPADDALVIEAHIRPADIAFLYPGQPVLVKLTAYDFARYGGLEGELITIAADAVEMPESGELMYPVEVRTEGYLYDADDQPLTIIPGMVAEVDILSGKRSVLEYLMEPVVKVRDRALRD
ncbi:MAG: HlyD family type I secretion periplasmic adaptor subunit [Halomonas sp.]|nr:HlyD family type I secretion periplasmic adaptor subunit [Halomonas sp.]MBR2513956.1 HlyD family type I secretion periplasmic adaptor subunit [Halomonas sp.]